ncbi:MAG: GAF domain-containing sensor histidine kinase [Caldimonas sp.]
MSESRAEIERDVAAIGRIEAVPSLLRVLCQMTGMGFAAVARVTDGSWTACAVQDDIAFGLKPGGELDVHSTLCTEVRESRVPIVIDHASADPVYCNHHTPRIYSIESYISVPIVLGDGSYFGNLCAIDAKPALVSEPKTVAMFTLFAQLVALELDNERRRDEERKAHLDEKESGELREQFIAVLGHDLRNPLSAVAACAELLNLKASEPVVVRSLAARIGTNVDRMARLIEDVLDFARGRLGGGVELGTALVGDLGDALRQVVDEMRDAHPDRQIRAEIDVTQSLHCDRGRIQQLASNLLANALTHGAKDRPIEFAASLRDAQLVIEVANNGEPIPEGSLAKIFAPFWRRETSNRRAGLGLGLYISDQIVKAHGGRLSVTSTREAGTRFVATLPAAV